MCTAIALRGENFYFGRNMDIYYDLDFDTARVRAEDGFSFSNGYRLSRCYGILGTAVVRDGYPLFADAMNTEGLCMAGLEFPDLAYYFPYQDWHKSNISPYEFIPWILTQCASVDEAEELLETTVLSTPVIRLPSERAHKRPGIPVPRGKSPTIRHFDLRISHRTEHRKRPVQFRIWSHRSAR